MIDQARSHSLLNTPLSIDAVLFSLIVGALIVLRIELPFMQVTIGSPAMKATLTLLIGLYWAVDLWSVLRMRRLKNWLKTSLIWAAIFMIVVLPTLVVIIQRSQTTPDRLAHDGLVQSEAATAFVLKGLNPYVEDYRSTPLAKSPFTLGGLAENPALDYYAYLPLTFLIPLPFQAAAGVIAPGWFDQRSVYLLLFVATLAMSSYLTSDPIKRWLLLMGLGLNPMLLPFFIEGRNDIVVLFEIVLMLLFMQRGHLKWATVVLALACVTKQVAWFVVPFYLMYVAGSGSLRDRWVRVRPLLIILVGVSGVFLLPWLVMAPAAFLGDIFYFQSGLSAHSFPINGISFGMLLRSLGWINSNVAAFPFWLIQLGVSLLLAWLLLRRQNRQRTVAAIPMYAGMFMFAYGFFSQFFHDNYLGFIVLLILVGWLLDEPRVGDPHRLATDSA